MHLQWIGLSMSAIRLAPPRLAQHVNFVACLIGIGVGLAFIGAAIDPEIRSWPVGVMGVLSLAVSVWAAVRSYGVHVLLDDAVLHIHGTFWSRHIPRDRITAISDNGQVEYKDTRGYGMTVQIVWLMRHIDDDERFVLARLQGPWRKAIKTLRDWAHVRGTP